MTNTCSKFNSYVTCNANKCIGCRTCMAACYESAKQRGKLPKARLIVYDTWNGTMPNQCHQCNNAPCANICPVGALTFGQNCIELHEEKCIGCKMCMMVCPFGCISVECEDTPVDYYEKYSLVNIAKRSKSVAVKCDLCEGREGGGHACVDACPTEALMFITPEAAKHLNEAKAVNSMTSMFKKGV